MIRCQIFSPGAEIPLKELNLGAVLTLGCSTPAPAKKKLLLLGKKLGLWQTISSSGKFVKIRNFMDISHFSTSHECFVLCMMHGIGHARKYKKQLLTISMWLKLFYN
jgi:hypothetical protein